MTKTETVIPVPLIGTANGTNKGAFHWSYEKLACLANGSEVFLVDTGTLEVVQVLSGHNSSVTHALWLPSGRQFVSAESKLSNRDIVSADASNQIIVWDALTGQQVGNFIHPDGSRQILDIQIPHGSDLWVRAKLYILYTGNILTIFDHAHGSFQNITIANPTLDTLGIPDQFIRFGTDPYFANQFINCLAFLAWDGITNTTTSVSICNFWDYQKDTRITIHKRLALDGKSFTVGTTNAFGNSPSSTNRNSGSNISPTVVNSDTSKRQMTSSTSIRKLVSDIIVGTDYSASTLAQSQLQGSIAFHPGIKDTIIVSTEASIYFINVHFMIVLNTFAIEKQGVPIVQVIPTKLRPCLFTLHENGTIVLRKYAVSGIHNMAIQLETICYNENPRFAGKKTEVIGCVIHPFDENSVIMYLNDGRLLKYDILGTRTPQISGDIKQHLNTPSTPYIRNLGFADPPISGAENNNSNTSKLPCSSPKHSSSLTNMVKSIIEAEPETALVMQLKRITHAFGQFTCIKSQGELLVAGTTTGFIVVLKIVNNRLKAVKKFTTHASSPVSGIAFVSDTEILTFSNLSFSANPKCELVLTEIWTGASRALKMDDNYHIQALRVSPLGQYFVVVYKNGMGPCELWDLPRRQLIKTLPNKLPPITCIHWRDPTENSKEEVFYMTDLGAFLFTFRVEGNRFLNATCVKLEHTSHVAGIPTSLFSRNELVFRADSNAVVVMYNTLKKTASPSISIGRGPLLGFVKVPGDENNHVVQFADNLVLWESDGLKKVKTLHPGKLKTSSVAVLQEWVAYIPKGSNGIRLLPLGLTGVAVSAPISHFSFPYFMDGAEKASKVLYLCEENCSTVADLLGLSREFGSREEYNFWQILHTKLKDGKFVDVDILCDKVCYKDTLVKTAQCVWAADYKKREEVAKVLLWTGESERGAEILLDTEPSDTTAYVLNGLKASVAVGSNNMPEQSKAVMKIIATNLIACGDMDGGLELLCLLQKHSEACKYVESNNEWAKAILLCKTALNEKNAEDSMCKYAQYLNSKKCAYKAASVYIFLGKFDRAIEVLFGARLRHLSYLLLHMCDKQNITLSISDHIRTAISLDFARFIFECGLQKEAIKFCESMAEKGNDLKQELEILSS